MAEPVSSREILGQVQNARERAIEAIAAAQDSAARYVRIKRDYERAYGEAFDKVIKEKLAANVEHAKQLAMLATLDEREAFDKITESKRLDRDAAHMWEQVLETFKALNYLVGQEHKTERAVA